jgi:hypothetical protein
VHKLLILLVITFTSLPVLAQTDDLSNLYEDKINKMIENGVISSEDGEQQLMKLKLSNKKEQQKFNNQVRGVASKIQQIKIYQFDNEPIEIQSK